MLYFIFNIAFLLMGGYLYTIGRIRILNIIYFVINFYIFNNNFILQGESNMKIKTEFKGNNIPYEYAAGADVSDSNYGIQLSHFHF